jgi:hypothetical protein
MESNLFKIVMNILGLGIGTTFSVATLPVHAGSRGGQEPGIKETFCWFNELNSYEDSFSRAC